MTEGDIPQVLAIQDKLSFQDWNEKQFLSEIKASYALCVVYCDGQESDASIEETNKISGYAIFHLMAEDSELLSIAVCDSCQQKGIGTMLLDAGLSRLDFEKGDKCFLEVREGNTKARKFYEKKGFSHFGTRKKYYSDGENACLYSISHAKPSKPQGV